MDTNENDCIQDITTRVIFEISSAVSNTLSLEAFYKEIHKSLGKILRADNFGIALYHRDRDAITFPYFVDEVDTDLSKVITEVSRKESLTARVINANQPLLFSEEEMAGLSSGRKHTIGTPAKIWGGVPLKIRGKAFGAMIIQDYHDRDAIKESDLAILNSVSEFVAMAIERKQIEDEIKQSEKLTRTLFRISNAANTSENLNDLYLSIYDSLNRLIDLPNFFICLVDEEKKVMHFPFYIDEHDEETVQETVYYGDNPGYLTVDVIETKQPVFLTKPVLERRHRNDRAAGTPAVIWVGVPLMVRDMVIGVMAVQHYTDPNYFSQKDMDLLVAVSDQVALAIDRKKTQEEIEQKEKLTQTLFTIANAANTSESLSALYRTIYQALDQLFTLPNFYIAIYQEKKNAMFFPFYIDEFDYEGKISFVVDNIAEKPSITTEVIANRTPMLLGREELEKKKKEKMITGTLPVIWLGIPLTIRHRVIGVMAVQHYRDPEYFTQKDLDFFVAVSDQIALAIDRKHSQEIIREREKQILNLSRQTQEFSLVAAAILTMTDEQEVFDYISRSIVEYSDYNRVIMSYFIDEKPFRKIIGFAGVGKQEIDAICSKEMPKSSFDEIFRIAQPVSGLSCYLPHTQVPSFRDRLSIIGSRREETDDGGWHPDDMLFIRMNDSQGNFIGVISVDDPKSGRKPTTETVRPLEIFSSLISQIIIIREIQDELREHKENLQKMVDDRTSALTEEIAERIQIEIKLKKAKIEAEAAARSKGEFLANMSHEIRTPINGIMGMSEIALEKTLTPELETILETINSEANSLLTIVNQVLDFSKIEAGKMELEQIPFDLRSTFEQACSSLAMGIDNPGIEFISFLPPDVPSALIGDPGRLRQVMVNLTSNAIKFTRKGEIFVKCELVNDSQTHVELRFIIRDTGIGIARDKHELVFESFRQADGSTTREYGGTGLGVSISKQLVELMNGEIGLESELGHGTTFWFTVRFTKQTRQETKHLSADHPIRGLTVLVADGNSTSRQVMNQYLGSFGVQCIETAGAAEVMPALERAVKSGRSVDAVVSQINFFGMNGFDLARKIKQSGRFSRMPVILLAPPGRIGDGDTCKDIGVDAYLVKPVKKEELQMAIASVINPAAGKRENAAPLVTRHSIAEKIANNYNVLLVEDYPTNQKVATKHLSSAGFHVTLAENGKQAVALFKRKRFDLILMDIQMPVMDGYEATRLIRGYEKTLGEITMKREAVPAGDPFRPSDHTPIVAMTAHAIAGYREKCLDAGMDDYISKPLHRDMFLGLVRKWTIDRKAQTKSDGSAGISDRSGTAADKRDQLTGLPMNFDRALEEFENDREFLVEVIQEFMQNVDQQLPKIALAVTSGNSDVVQKQSHAIKGGAANLTADRLAGAAYDLEKLGKTGAIDKYPDAFGRLKDEIDRLYDFLESRGIINA